MVHFPENADVVFITTDHQPVVSIHPQPKNLPPTNPISIAKKKIEKKIIISVISFLIIAGIISGLFIWKPWESDEHKINSNKVTGVDNNNNSDNTNNFDNTNSSNNTNSTDNHIIPNTNWEENVLMCDKVEDYGADVFYVFGTAFHRSRICSVTFIDSLNGIPTYNIYDISAAQNGKIILWFEENGTNYNMFIASDGGVNAADEACNYLFYMYTNLKEINFNNCFHTENATNMSFMFYKCNALENLDLSSLNTSNVKDMSYMFTYCNSLNEINVSNWNTSNNTTMLCMFSNCNSLKELDLSNFDTSNVTTMELLFHECNSLEKLDISSFNTFNVTEMSFMFCGCSSIQKLDISSFDNSNVTLAVNMFDGTQFIYDYNPNTFDISKIS